MNVKDVGKWRLTCTFYGNVEKQERSGGAFNEFRNFNALITHINQQKDKVQEYEDIFKIGNMGYESRIKIKIIQGMIQLERPSNWSMENIKKIANEIQNIELYNAKKE